MSVAGRWCVPASEQSVATSLGLLVLRVGAGGFMASHGLGKLQMLAADQAAQFGDPIGLGPMPSLLLVTFAELACALLVLVGLATHVAAIPPVIAMAVAAFVAHAADPWSSGTAAKAFFEGTSKTWFSKEPALLFLVAFLSLAFAGAGRWSLDAVIGRAWRRRRTERAAAPA